MEINVRMVNCAQTDTHKIQCAQSLSKSKFIKKSQKITKYEKHDVQSVHSNNVGGSMKNIPLID